MLVPLRNEFTESPDRDICFADPVEEQRYRRLIENVPKSNSDLGLDQVKELPHQS